jgi:predicted ATPase
MKLALRFLRVKECGPLRDVCIDFCDVSGKPRPVTVLAGANGSGKTTVLELIATLAELIDRNSRRFTPRPRSVSERSILARTDYAVIEMNLEDAPLTVTLSSEVDEESETSYVLLPEHQGYFAIEGDTNFQQERINKLQDLIWSSQKRNIAFPDFASWQLTEMIFAPSILYFPHSRQLMSLSGTQIQKDETKFEWVHRYENVREFAGSLDSYLIWLDYAEPETFARVIKFLNELDFDGKTFGVLRKELKAIVTTRDGRTHGVAELSSGEQNILIMCLELRRRLLPHSIVLIDEIENSLHPAFQYRLALALKRMQESIPFQLILTTHAPAFVEIFGPESTLILTEF